MNKILFSDIPVLENNTRYEYSGNRLDIHMEDTIPANDRKYRSVNSGYGEYRNVAFWLQGLKNVILDFRGASIVLHGGITPFILDECENITIQNVTIECDRSVYTEFEVVDCSATEMVLATSEKYPYCVEDGNLYPYSDHWKYTNLDKGPHFFQAFEGDTGKGAGSWIVSIGKEYKGSIPAHCKPTHLNVREENDKIILTGEIPAFWKKGMIAVLDHGGRINPSVGIYHSKDILLKDCRILNGSGMGFQSFYTENITFDSIKLSRDALSHGTVTNVADAIHLVSCKGKILIKDSVLEGMIDDAMNVHNNFYVAEHGEVNTLKLRRTQIVRFLDAYSCVFGAGDVIAVYNGHSMQEKARYTIQKVKIISGEEVEIETEEPLNVICKGDIIENLSTNPELIVQNSRFGKANSHLRFQTRGKILVENCESELPFLLSGDMNLWYEAGPVRDMTVKDCVFKGHRGNIVIHSCDGRSITEQAPYYHGGIKIIDNLFETETILIANAADNILLQGNKIADSDADPKISAEQCIGIEVR